MHFSPKRKWSWALWANTHLSADRSSETSVQLEPDAAGNNSNVQDPQTEGKEYYWQLTELQNLNKVGSFIVSV